MCNDEVFDLMIKGQYNTGKKIEKLNFHSISKRNIQSELRLEISHWIKNTLKDLKSGFKATHFTDFIE